MSPSPVTLFEALQSEFCPPLDSSLLAALLAEIESDADGNPLTPSDAQILDLQSTLCELAAQADESQLSEFSDLQLTDGSCSTPDFYNGNTVTTLTSDSRASESSDSGSHLPFSSPLGFLQAALPHIPTARLNKALEDAEKGDKELDMWDVVAGILSHESILELEERGIDGIDDDENLVYVFQDEDADWETIGTKKKPRDDYPHHHHHPGAVKTVKKKPARPTRIAIVDIRQQHHIRGKKPNSQSQPAPDPWTQLSSLSSHVATLLPPHPVSFFQSYFHSPDYPTPYDALCAALTSISHPHEAEPSLKDQHTTVLFNLLDILLSEFDTLDAEQRARLISDAELVVNATNGRGDDALDLAKLLQELDSDASSYLEMGVYHHQAPRSPTLPLPLALSRNPSIQPQQKTTQRPSPALPSMPPPVPDPPLARGKPKPPPTGSKPSPYQWQSVPSRRVPARTPYAHAQHIPAYTRDVNGRKTHRGTGAMKGVELLPGALAAAEYRKKRDELLREATRMWQKGNTKTRGGEVAFYFAERAREFQELARQEALNAARVMVESKRLATGTQDTVDLHGTTVSEAIVIVQDILREYSCSQSKPLKIITGRGAHSVNQVSVLKPAVRKALVEQGWAVGTWDGGLVVRGKRA